MGLQRLCTLEIVAPRGAVLGHSPAMANAATLRRFEVELADIDRGVYASLDLRVAHHPSEAADRVVVRVLARALAHEEGLDFGRGVSNPEEPAIFIKDATGRVALWVDIGAPSAERVHRASKAAARVVIYTHKPQANLVREWGRKRIHNADEVEVVLLPAALVDELEPTVSRSQSWVVTRMDGHLTVNVEPEGVSASGPITATTLARFLAT